MPQAHPQQRAEQQQVRPVDEHGAAVRGERGEHRGREWHQRHAEQVEQMDPGEPEVTAIQVVELRLLAIPEDAEGKKAHQVDEQPRPYDGGQAVQRALAVDDVQHVQDQQGHRDGKDAVGQRRQPLEAGAGEPVIGGRHVVSLPRESIAPSRRFG
jgi:hypothetical protein